MHARVRLPAGLRVQRLRLLQSNQANGDRFAVVAATAAFHGRPFATSAVKLAKNLKAMGLRTWCWFRALEKAQTKTCFRRLEVTAHRRLTQM
jgi:hypothetical protein